MVNDTEPILAPEAAPVELAAPVIADCCGSRGDYQYMRLGGAWYQVGWIAVARKGKETIWRAFCNPAVACQACGHALSDATPVRRYHAGAFAPVDSIVQTLASPVLPAAKEG